LCIGRGDGSVWWYIMDKIWEDVGQFDGGWLRDNISRKVRDMASTLFWIDPWLDGWPLKVSFRKLFELAENKLVLVKDMFNMRWG
jgi:hypothetical protein